MLVTHCPLEDGRPKVDSLGNIFGPDYEQNTVFWLVISFLFMGVYYMFFCEKHWYQVKIHSFGKPWAWMLQWYGLYFLILFALMINEAWSLSWTMLSGIRQELLMRDDSLLWKVVIFLSFSGPIASWFGFALCAYHCINVFRRGNHRRRERHHHESELYRPSPVQDMVVLIIGLPIILMMMAAKSSIRMWASLSCEDLGFDANYDKQWYMINLEVASIWGYVIILIFSFLMQNILQRTIRHQDVRWAMNMSSYQGTWAFVVVGVASGLVNIGNGAVELYGRDENNKISELLDGAQPKIKLLSTVFMILCIYNMIVLCKVQIVKDALGGASLKFLATRTILILIQYQPIVFLFLADPDQYLVTSSGKKIISGSSIHTWIKNLGITTPMAKLINSTLLCWEGVIAVLFNYWAWEVNTQESELFKDEWGEKLRAADRSLGPLADDEFLETPSSAVARTEDEAELLSKVNGGAQVASCEALTLADAEAQMARFRAVACRLNDLASRIQVLDLQPAFQDSTKPLLQ